MKKQRTNKPRSLKNLARTAWDLMSKFVRQKESNYQGYCRCVSCGRVSHWKECDAGHFIHAGNGGKQNPVSYDERNIHSQCRICNRGVGAKHRHPGSIAIRYTAFVVEKYGSEIVDQLEAVKRQPWFRHQELEILIEVLRVKLDGLSSVPDVPRETKEKAA